MKSIKYLCIVGLIVSSCASLPDPNRPTDVDAMDIIGGPMIFDQFFHTGVAARQTALWTNQFQDASRSVPSLNNWNLYEPDDFNDSWSLAYAAIANCRIVISKSEDENPALSGVAKIIEAHIMGSVTSLWGDVPFSEACDETISDPKFDSQESIYTGIQLLLDEAILDLSEGGGVDANVDIFYAGDLSKWIKLAYTLKARFYLHIGKYADAKTNALLGISSPNEDMIAQYEDEYGVNMNPFYSFFVMDRSGYIGARDSYAPSLIDPYGFFSNIYGVNRNHAKHNEGDRFYYNYHNYELYVSGYEPNYLNGFDWDCEDCGKFGEDMPLVTYGETLLIIAEAEARLNGLAAGVSAYNQYRQLINTGYGFANNLENVGWNFPDFVDSDFSPGGVEDPLSSASAPVYALLREIYEERYVVFVGNIEAFTDLRRTANLAEIQLRPYDGTPQRFLYPESEVLVNKNVPNPLPEVLTATWAHRN